MLRRFFLIQESRLACCIVPTDTILPAAQSTAAFSIMPGSDNSRPRRGPREPRKVRSCRMLVRRSGGRSWDFCILVTERQPYLCKQGPLLFLSTRLAVTHRNLDSRFTRKAFSLFVSRVYMPGDADSGVICQHAFNAFSHCIGTVGDGDLAGMLGISNPNATSIVDGYP